MKAISASTSEPKAEKTPVKKTPKKTAKSKVDGLTSPTTAKVTKPRGRPAKAKPAPVAETEDDEVNDETEEGEDGADAA